MIKTCMDLVPARTSTASQNEVVYKLLHFQAQGARSVPSHRDVEFFAEFYAAGELHFGYCEDWPNLFYWAGCSS